MLCLLDIDIEMLSNFTNLILLNAARYDNFSEDQKMLA